MLPSKYHIIGEYDVQEKPEIKNIQKNYLETCAQKQSAFSSVKVLDFTLHTNYHKEMTTPFFSDIFPFP